VRPTHCGACPDYSLCAKCELDAEIEARAEELLEEQSARRNRTPTVGPPQRVTRVLEQEEMR
jgi:hypothetical protein